MATSLRWIMLNSCCRSSSAVERFFGCNNLKFAPRIISSCSLQPRRQYSSSIFNQQQNEFRKIKLLSILPQATSLVSIRFAHKPPLTVDYIRERVLLVLRLFDKIDPDKLTLDSHFYKDLGLDSLDHVEIIMTIEDEFHFEIPDSDAENLNTPNDIVKYIQLKEEVYAELEHHDDHHHEGHH